MIYNKNTFEFLSLLEITSKNNNNFFELKTTDVTFVWNRGCTMKIFVNQVSYQLLKNDIIILTKHHDVENLNFESARLIKFNLPFFSQIADEVENELKGAIFFNALSLPIISINIDELITFENSWDTFCEEMKSKDSLQHAMLQSILKRIIILCTRKLKKENRVTSENRKSNIIKEFSFLVENYFSKHHNVAFYASMLNKSPKTLSNIFSSLSNKTPTDIIHERIMVHARKQIYDTTKSIKEIAYELGYEDIQTFSRFFKNKEGLSPIQYRERVRYTSNAVVSSLKVN
ncbi:helix-turn-helix domain-containing protein [Flavobacterium aquatile]|uniref:helix-turn-helix domain-containing protein n=1 Tax=Flavobacterium aquatile TaxID=245 RepID=UPI000AD32DAE|nr:helix-turn-helix domain-containing protein [Flavobacterium aquatile]OXA67316.1 hypothetical protein B0A61_08050 [Flavobacterium aquatile LMG 4008 = ATCC 11947]